MLRYEASDPSLHIPYVVFTGDNRSSEVFSLRFDEGPADASWDAIYFTMPSPSGGSNTVPTFLRTPVSWTAEGTTDDSSTDGRYTVVVVHSADTWTVRATLNQSQGADVDAAPQISATFTADRDTPPTMWTRWSETYRIDSGAAGEQTLSLDARQA